jgi:hypothetical protein
MAFMDTLTNREIADIEDILEMPLTKLAGDNARVGRSGAALAWIVKRREDPSFTFDQAMDLTATETSALIPDDDEGTEDDPKDS